MWISGLALEAAGAAAGAAAGGRPAAPIRDQSRADQGIEVTSVPVAAAGHCGRLWAQALAK